MAFCHFFGGTRTIRTMAKQDDYTKTALRLPRDLHQILTESAAARGHSLNTEMVYRLEQSFAQQTKVLTVDQTSKLLTENTKMRLEMAKLRSHMRAGSRIPDHPALEPLDVARVHVTLDTSGHPISWDEISEHLTAIRKTGKFDVVAMHTSVITPDLESSSKRTEQSADLAKFYKGKPATKRIRRTKPDDSNQ